MLTAPLCLLSPLQYLNSLNLVKVNWSKIGARYTNTTAQADGAGATTVLTAKRVFNWVVDFLTRCVAAGRLALCPLTTGRADASIARCCFPRRRLTRRDFQQRATFVGGFVLGLRLG